MNKKAIKQFKILSTAQYEHADTNSPEVWRITLDGETSEQFFIMPLAVAVAMSNEHGIELRSASDGVTVAVAINDLHKYVGKEVQYNMNVGEPEADCWSPLVSVTASPYQGANVNLADGTTLQACFATAVYLVKA